MNFRLLFSFIALAISFECAGQTIIKSNDQRIRYSGRIAMTDSTAELSWSASSITVNFRGTGMSAVLKDERSDNNYNVIVDGNVIKVLHPAVDKETYQLADSLSPGK